MPNYNQDIIAAISTAVGDGAISIVRVSGDGSIELVDKIFKGKNKLTFVNGYTVHHGEICFNNQVFDEALAVVFRSPNSYTTEDMVELNCHGGWFITNRILQKILESGARLAEPGEFTKRAFLNGRIDLLQAEAVADLIKARSDFAHKTAIAQLEGNLSKTVVNINSQLINLVGIIELDLDFVEEQISLINPHLIIENINKIISDLRNLSESFYYGKLCKEGVKVVIAGKPNSGKSSLLNLLLKENRAIVTPVPGTTRDVIEENFTINGALFVLSDTAGIRKTSDFVEIEGVRRSKQKMKEADIVLYVIDSSNTDFKDDIELIKEIKLDNKHIILVLNKIDLVHHRNFSNNPIVLAFNDLPLVNLSTLTGEGIEKLRQVIFDSIFSEEKLNSETSIYITNERHRQAILEAIDSLSLAKSSAEHNLSNEFTAFDIRAAINSLGSITGRVTTDDIINNIFSKFCIGK